MQNFYIKWMIVFGIAAVAMSIPQVAINALYMTVGLAFPFLYGATVFIYSACILPFIMTEGESKKVRAFSLIVSICLLAATAYGPNWYAKRLARTAATNIVFSKLNIDPKQEITSIEIRREINNEHFFISQRECGLECFAILQKGKVKWIKVVVIDADGVNSSLDPLSVYSFSHDKECQNAKWSRGSEKRCLIKNKNKVGEPSVVLKFNSQSTKVLTGIADTKWYKWLSLKSVEVTSLKENDSEPIYQHTEVDFVIVAAPFIVHPEMSATNSDGMEWDKEIFRVNPVSLTKVLNVLGFNVGLEKPDNKKF